MDQWGRPVPWFTQPAIDFLRQFDYSDKTVFEWGAGHSTLFWAERCRSVVSIESDSGWANYLSKLIPSNVELVTSQTEDEYYVGHIHGRGKFHVIVIDGTDHGRPGAAAALDHPEEGGMIILDNADSCLKAAVILRERLIEIDFTGFAPGSGYAHTTPIFFKNLDFKPTGIRPVASPAQPNSPWPRG